VRLGTYGDPAAVPAEVWRALLSEAAGWTGYTHQWRAARLRDVLEWCQASCDAPEDVEHARRLGAVGTFRVGAAGALDMLPGEVLCPASAEAGKVTTCDRCGLCAGRTGATVYIPAHGTSARLVTGQGRRALAVLG
jgi:hypothetical protein